jgi:hypothetical protein
VSNRCALVVVATILIAAPTAAEAQPRLTQALGEIRAHVHALRYHEARGAAEAALALGEGEPRDVAALYRVLGEVSAGLDDIAGATRWFTRLLAIEPDARLPAGSSPKLTGPFQAARLASAKLDVAIAFASGAVVVRARDDRAKLVRAARVRVIHGGIQRAPIAAVIDTPIAIDAGDGDAILADALDEHGNRLATVGLRVGVADRSLLRRPLPYAIAGGVALAAGGIFLWRRAVALDDLDAIIANSDQYTFEDAQAAERRAERHGYFAIAGFGLAAIAGATAVIIHLTAESTLVVTPWTASPGVSATVRF